MGLTVTDINLLLAIRDPKRLTARIATIGKQSLYLHPKQIWGLKHIISESQALANYRWGEPADSFLLDLTGAKEVVSIDASNYQGSSVIHDMNLPLVDKRPDLAGQFDLVIDGGTLEHVFNFPVAVANLMFLVRKGGHILTGNPANNLCGHGFYQFTPELMYRIYSKANGFHVRYMLLTEARYMSIEMDPHPKSFSVVDPETVGQRILIQNKWPVIMRTLAKRVGNPPQNGLIAQQSDYVAAWSGATRPKSVKKIKTALRQVLQRLPLPLQRGIYKILRRNTLGNPQVMSRWLGLIE